MNAATPDRAKALRVEVARSIDEFASIWPTASNPGEARLFPFQCADVLRIWCNTLGKDRKIEPLFVAVRDSAGAPVLLLPLGLQQTGGVRLVQFLDCGISDYNAPVVFPANLPEGIDAEGLWDLIRARLPSFDLAMLDKMPERVAGRPNPLAGLATSSHQASCHGVTLCGPWEAFARTRLPNARDSRRRLRKLEQRGPVRFRIAETEKERQQFFDAMVRQKRRQFLETGAHDLFAETAYRRFYSDATRLLGAGGSVQISALLVGDQIVATDWGFVCGDRYFDLIPSYEAGEWRPYAPGRLLTEWLLQHHLEQGRSVFDYGIGDERYKYDYCDVHSPLVDAHLPVTVKGAIYARAARVRSAIGMRLQGTRVGTALRAARNALGGRIGSRLTPVVGERLPAWLAVIGSASVAIDC